MSKQHPKVKALREFNRWRRGMHDDQPNPEEIGYLIEWAIAVCDSADKLINAKGKQADKVYVRLEAAVQS